jgi:hypothetical protein
VLAILPTATENILDAIPVEQILDELQKHKAERLSRSAGPSEVASSAPPSVTDDDGKSLTSFQSESYVHASQMAGGDGSSESPNGEGAEGSGERKPKKSKAQLWNEMKISCRWSRLRLQRDDANGHSYIESVYPNLHTLPPHPSYADTAQSSRPTKLPGQRCLVGVPAYAAVDYQLGES